MNEERLQKIRWIYENLSRLEDSREEKAIKGENYSYIEAEMVELRILLQKLMNDACPVLRSRLDDE
jgi:hypothetical protein